MRILRRALMVLMVATAACEPLEDESETPEPPEPVEPPDPVDPTRVVGPITEISPRAAALGQALKVTIKLGGKDKPGPGTEVSFGLGVDVLAVTEVAGGLDVDIVIETDTTSGPRDVIVTPDDAPVVTAPKGFTIATAMDLVAGAGKAEQGGLVRLDAASKDGRPLAAATFALDPVVDAGTPTLVQIARGAFTATTGQIFMLGDPLAKTGPLSFIGENDPEDSQSAAFFAANAVDVAARAPVTLASGVVSNATLSAPLQTAFYGIDLAPQAGEGVLVDAIAGLPGGSTLKPVVYAYPASGRMVDLLEKKEDNGAVRARIAYPAIAPTKGFFVVVDKDFASSPTSTLAFDYRTYRGTIIAEQAGAHGLGSPQNLGALPAMGDAVPGRIITGTLAAAGEVDTYMLTGFPAGVRDVQVSFLTEADIDVIVDHVPGFDDDPTTINTAEQIGSGTTTGFIDTNRYIRVSATSAASKPIGKYTLSIRAVN